MYGLPYLGTCHFFLCNLFIYFLTIRTYQFVNEGYKVAVSSMQQTSCDEEQRWMYAEYISNTADQHHIFCQEDSISLSSQRIGYISVFHCVKNIFIKALDMNFSSAEFVLNIILTYIMLQSLRYKSKHLFLAIIYLTLAFLSLCGSGRLCKKKHVSPSSFFPNLPNMVTFHNLTTFIQT